MQTRYSQPTEFVPLLHFVSPDFSNPNRLPKKNKRRKEERKNSMRNPQGKLKLPKRDEICDLYPIVIGIWLCSKVRIFHNGV